MDGIEISIERGSEPPRRPASQTPQINPRIAGGVAVVFVLALVMWLGAQTPARTTPTSVPATTTTTVAFESTTSTTEAQFAAPPSSITPDLSSPLMLEWLTDLEANPPAALTMLSSPVLLFVFDRNGVGRLVELGPGEVNSTELVCGRQPVAWVMGQMAESMIVTSGETTCFVSLDRPYELVIIPGAGSFVGFVPSGPDTGWFCEQLSNTTAAVVKFEIGGEPSDQFVVPTCPLAAEGDELLLHREDEAQPFVWKVGDALDTTDIGEAEKCELAGYSERFRLCRVGEHVEFRNYFSNVDFKIPANPDPDILWFAVVSPDETRVLLVPYEDSSGLIDSGLVVFDFETEQFIDLDTDFRRSVGSWLSNGELLLQPIGGYPERCEDCAKGLILLNVDTGESAQLLELGFGQDSFYVQVLGS